MQAHDSQNLISFKESSRTSYIMHLQVRKHRNGNGGIQIRCLLAYHPEMKMYFSPWLLRYLINNNSFVHYSLQCEVVGIAGWWCAADSWKIFASIEATGPANCWKLDVLGNLTGKMPYPAPQMFTLSHVLNFLVPTSRWGGAIINDFICANSKSLPGDRRL